MCYVYYTCRQGGRERQGERGREGGRERERGERELQWLYNASNHNTMLCVCVCVGVYGVLHASPDYIMMCMSLICVYHKMQY